MFRAKVDNEEGQRMGREGMGVQRVNNKMAIASFWRISHWQIYSVVRNILFWKEGPTCLEPQLRDVTPVFLLHKGDRPSPWNKSCNEIFSDLGDSIYSTLSEKGGQWRGKTYLKDKTILISQTLTYSTKVFIPVIQHTISSPQLYKVSRELVISI